MKPPLSRILLFCSLLFMVLVGIATRSKAQSVDTFTTRYHLKQGTVLVYHLKVFRSPSTFGKRGVREYEDSVQANVVIAVDSVTPSGIMILNTEVQSREEETFGRPRYWSEVPLPPRAYIEMLPTGRCDFASVIEEDSSRQVSKVLSRTPAGSHVPLMKDKDYVRAFIRYFMPEFGGKGRVYDGEHLIDSVNTQVAYLQEEDRNVKGQLDPKIVAASKKEHELWRDTSTVSGPGSFNGTPVFKIDQEKSAEGARFEKFAGGLTGNHEADVLNFHLISYFRVADGALVARDNVERSRRGNVQWNDRTSVRLISSTVLAQ